MEPPDNSIDTQLVHEFWRKRAEQQDNRWTPIPYLSFEIEKIQEFIAEKRELSILDLGSGSGSLSRSLTKPNDTLTAVDFEANYERFFREDSRYRFIHCEVDKFKSSSKFDLILLFGVVTHLNAREENITYQNIKSMISEDTIVIVKNQCSDSSEFIFNGFSKELGANYSARYPNILEQRDKLLRQFEQVEIIEYPSWSKKHQNSSHLMFICRKSRPD